MWIQTLLSVARLGIYLRHSGEIQVLSSDARCGFLDASCGARLGIYLLRSGEIQVLNSDAKCGFSDSDSNRCGFRFYFQAPDSGEFQMLNSDARCGFRCYIQVLDSESMCCVQVKFRCSIQMLDVNSDAKFRC